MKGRFAPLLLVLGMASLVACEDLPPAPELPNDPPTADFFFNPVAPIYAGQTMVAFNAMGSRDRDGKIVSYVWNFGDGGQEETTSEPIIQHAFPDTSARCISVTYGVLLTLVDDRDGRGYASHNVTVVELPLPSAPECQVR